MEMERKKGVGHFTVRLLCSSMFSLNYPSCNKEETVIVIYQTIHFFAMSAHCIWLQLDISTYKKFVFPCQATQRYHWILGVSILKDYGLSYLNITATDNNHLRQTEAHRLFL